MLSRKGRDRALSIGRYGGALAAIVFCFMSGSAMGPGSAQETTTTAIRSEVARPSGLQPIFSDKARCPEIASPFGSRTRYDGSRRPGWAPGGGTHGGIDLTLDNGTPLLALAAGTVTNKGQGGQMLGIYIWLRHSPEDTGLPQWIYSKYQHLESLPDLPVGARVTMGQIVGRSGSTGTFGGHYGAKGYPHLHLTALKSPRGEYRVDDSRVVAVDQTLVDPVLIYHEANRNPQQAAGSSRDKTPVPIPYMTPDGRAWPPDTRVIWPVACLPK